MKLCWIGCHNWKPWMNYFVEVTYYCSCGSWKTEQTPYCSEAMLKILLRRCWDGPNKLSFWSMMGYYNGYNN
jgi:hypothetical protein